MASIFSVQNLQTFLRRKNLPRPPGPPEGRPPGPPWGRGPPERGPGPELLGPEPDSELACGAPESDDRTGVSSGITVSSLLSSVHHRPGGRRRTMMVPGNICPANARRNKAAADKARRLQEPARQQLRQERQLQRAPVQAWERYVPPCGELRVQPSPWPGACLPRQCAR